MNSGLSGKDTDAGKKLKAEKKRMAEDEMVGWHHQFNEHEFGDILGDGKRQGSLVCCSPCGCEQLDMTWRWNNSLMRSSTLYHIRYFL